MSENRLDKAELTLEEVESRLDAEAVRSEVEQILDTYGEEDYSDDLIEQLEMALKLENKPQTKDGPDLKRRGNYGNVRELAEYLDYISNIPKMRFPRYL